MVAFAPVGAASPPAAPTPGSVAGVAASGNVATLLEVPVAVVVAGGFLN